MGNEPLFDCREPGYAGPMYQGACHPCHMCDRCVRELEETAVREGWNG
jgi:Fe-S cluster biogenesis protein NfuA